MKPVCELFLVMAALSADPIPPPNQTAPPKIVSDPTPTQPAPAPLPVGTPTALDVNKFLFLDVQGYKGAVTWAFSTPGIVALLPDAPAGITSQYYPGVTQGESSPQWHKPPTVNSVPCLGVKEGSTKISAWGVVDGRAKLIAELTMQIGPAPPKPDDPIVPKPPQPVTSFRVFLIYESGTTYTAAVNSVLYGNVVEEWLNANCTGGKAGWRRRDKDLSGDADPTMAAMWNAIKPNVTTIPCVGVEVNGKVELIPLEKTPAELVKKF